MKIPFKIRALLWFINRDKNFRFHNFTASEVRLNTEKRKSGISWFLDYGAIGLFRISDREIQGRNAMVPIRIYQPSDEENLPLIMYFHGGGFVISSIDSHDNVCRRIARDNKAVVISVGYRLAPEHKFPIALHDCYDATVWASENADMHKWDSSRLAVMGDSAGGNLAAGVSLMSRDSNGPGIACQVLIYPCTDATLSSPSIDTYGKNLLLTKEMLVWFNSHYQSKKEDLLSPYLSMMLAEDLANLPPAFVLTAEYDPLKDEGCRYAERMRESGNEVVYKDYGGLVHGFITMPRMSKLILKVYDDIRKVLSKVF